MPLLPFATLERLSGDLHALVADPLVRTALALASESIDAALERGADDACALLAYIARMAGRPVPFGLFAGCTAGAVCGTPSYAFGSTVRQRARLDVAVLDRRTEPTTVVPNPTAHLTAERLRLVERDAEGRYHQVAVEPDDVLLATLDRARAGATPADLAAALVDDDITTDDALEYVADLVAAQILVPATGPVLTGDDPRAALPEIDSPERLRAVVAQVRAADIGLPADRAVHVDSSRVAERVVLGDAVLAEVYRAIEVLHPLGRATAADGDLAAFREAFTARYGAAEVPLLAALDEETGVGFGAPTALAAAGAPLLSGLNPAPSTDGPIWTPIDHHLLDLLSRALRLGVQEIELDVDDLGPLRTPDQRPLPDAIAVRATIAAPSADAVAAGEFRLVVHDVSGPNGAALLSRFAAVDPGIDALVRAHVASEEALRPDATFAEIAHLPEGRAANTAVRPLLREHDIPLLGVSGAPSPIPLDDLRVSVAGDRIVLRSERLGCEVLPRLTAAHDWQASALPLYRFLGAVAHEGTVGLLRWSWGQVQSAPFLPRVVVGRLVLARAQWRWFRLDLRHLESATTPEKRYDAVQRLRTEWRVPRWVGLAFGDSEIPVDLDAQWAAELLGHEARRAGQLMLRECLPGPDDLCVTAPEGAFTHEFVLPLVRRSPAPVTPVVARQRGRTHVPGSEWLGARLFTGVATADGVLRDVVPTLVARADLWFYERHADPAPHLRLRVHGEPAALLDRLHDVVTPLVESGRVTDVLVDTYRASLVPEAISHADSVAALALLADDDLGNRWRATLRGIDLLLAGHGRDLAARAVLVRQWRAALVAAHGETGERARRAAGRIHRRERFAVVADHGPGGLGDDALAELCAQHANRRLRAAHDVQLLVLYDLLARAYRAATRPGGAGR